MKDEPTQEPERTFYRTLKSMRRGIRELQRGLRGVEALRPDELTQALRLERARKIRRVRAQVCKTLAGYDQMKSQYDELFKSGKPYSLDQLHAYRDVLVVVFREMMADLRGFTDEGGAK
jgi:hypothetical protein